MAKLTTQQIYNKILEIQEKGDWIESSFRHITWIPVAEVENLTKHNSNFTTDCYFTGCPMHDVKDKCEINLRTCFKRRSNPS